MLVGHTHFDHAVDAPALARRFGCSAYGSESLQRLMALHGLADRAVVVEPYATYELGPFEVSFTPSRHSKLLLGVAVPFDGELTCDHLDGLNPGAYRCGQVWGIEISVAGTTLYHQGSADLDDSALRIRPRRGRRLPRRGRRPQLHRALLGADPAEARSEADRPHPLRRLLRAARRRPGDDRQRPPGRAAGGDRRGQLRRAPGGDPAPAGLARGAAIARLRLPHLADSRTGRTSRESG